MGMTAFRLRERRARERLVSPPPVRSTQETEAERVARMRAEAAALRAKVAPKLASPEAAAPVAAKVEAKPVEPSQPQQWQKNKHRG